MKTYTIIAGVNGVGKSSFTGILKGERSDLGRIINVDRIIAEEGGDVLKGGKRAIFLIEDSLAKGICFTQETTLSGHRTLDTVKRAIQLGYEIRLYYIGLNSVEESLRRIENRVNKGGHAINEWDVRRRYDKRLSDLTTILPYCDEAAFYDNENGFRLVGQYRNGEILPVGQTVPDWLEELISLFLHTN